MPLLSDAEAQDISLWMEGQTGLASIPVEDMMALLADRQERIELAVALVSLVNQCVGSLELLAPDIAERKRQQLRELGGKVVCPGCSDDNDDCRCLRPGSKSLCSLCSYPDHHSPDPRYAALRNVLTEECGPDHDIVFDLNGCCRCQGTGYSPRRVWEKLPDGALVVPLLRAAVTAKLMSDYRAEKVAGMALISLIPNLYVLTEVKEALG